MSLLGVWAPFLIQKTTPRPTRDTIIRPKTTEGRILRLGGVTCGGMSGAGGGGRGWGETETSSIENYIVSYSFQDTRAGSLPGSISGLFDPFTNRVTSPNGVKPSLVTARPEYSGKANTSSIPVKLTNALISS